MNTLDFLTSHWLFKEPRKMSRFEAYMDCLRSAVQAGGTINFRGRSIELPAGGFIASQRYLAHRWGWSHKQVRTFISALVKTGELAQQRAQGMPVLVLVSGFAGHTEGRNETR